MGPSRQTTGTTARQKGTTRQQGPSLWPLHSWHGIGRAHVSKRQQHICFRVCSNYMYLFTPMVSFLNIKRNKKDMCVPFVPVNPIDYIRSCIHCVFPPCTLQCFPPHLFASKLITKFVKGYLAKVSRSNSQPLHRLCQVKAQ